MLLAIDIGNTNITFGVFDGDKLVARARVATVASRMPDEYGLMLNQLLELKGVDSDGITDVCMCSVVPPLSPAFIELCRSYLNIEPLVVGAGTKTGIRTLRSSSKQTHSSLLPQSPDPTHGHRSALY